MTLTWAYRDGVSTNVWSVDATHTGDMTLGTLELSMPVVYVYGMTLCADFERTLLLM